MTSQPCACALTRGTRSAGKSSSSVSYSSAFYNSKRAKFGHWATLIALFTPNIYLWGFGCIQVQMQETQLLLFAKNKCTVLFSPPHTLQYLNKKPHPGIATPAATAASPSLYIALSSSFILFCPKLQHFLLFRCCAYYILIASFVLCAFKHTLLFVQCRS